MTTQGTYTGWDFSVAWKPMTGILTGYYPCLAWQSVSTCVPSTCTITYTQATNVIKQADIYNNINKYI